MARWSGKLERVLKGVANHRRLEILNLIFREPELGVADISERLNFNFKTASEHIRRLALAGLVLKRYEGASVRHKATSRGVKLLEFLRKLE